MANDRILMNSLLDFYGVLLTDKQREICEYYYREDLSLLEISELEGISRSAVHDTIKRCREELRKYEDQLHMLSSYQKRMDIYRRIKAENNEKISALIDQCINIESE